LKNGLTLKIENEIASKPYINLTIAILKHFGIVIKQTKNLIIIPNQPYIPKNITLSGDWSAASYWYEIAALSDNVDFEIEGLNINTMQADGAVMNIFKNFGINTTFLNNSICLKKIKIKKSEIYKYSLLDSPDLFPSIAVSAAALNIKTNLTNLKNLEFKESNRLSAIIQNLNELGFKTKTTETQDLIIEKQTLNKIKRNPRNPISTYKDHRIAMAFAPLASIFNYITLDNIDVVKKSYPDFWKDISKFNFSIEKLC